MSDSLPAPHSTSDGIYVLRTTQQNQIQMNLMADQKANIMIGISLIFGTIAQQELLSRHLDDPMLVAPFVLLGLTMLGTFGLSLVIVAPRVGRLIRCQPAEMPNALFFGHFPGTPEDDYTTHLLDRLKSPVESREILIRDIYQTGKVLRRKYRLLRFAYLCLGVGVLTSAGMTVMVLLRAA